MSCNNACAKWGSIIDGTYDDDDDDDDYDDDGDDDGWVTPMAAAFVLC